MRARIDLEDLDDYGDNNKKASRQRQNCTFYKACRKRGHKLEAAYMKTKLVSESGPLVLQAPERPLWYREMEAGHEGFFRLD